MEAEQVIVMMWDMEGFSLMLSSIETLPYAERVCDFTFQCVEDAYTGKGGFWSVFFPRELPKPVFENRMGDGGLYVFRVNDFAEGDIMAFVARLCEFAMSFKGEQVQKHLHRMVTSAVEVPRRIRVSIVQTFLGWGHLNTGFKYGKPYSRGIVVASKLLKHCGCLSIIIGANLDVPRKLIEGRMFKLVSVKNVRGIRLTPEESMVFVEKSEFNALSQTRRNACFHDYGEANGKAL